MPGAGHRNGRVLVCRSPLGRLGRDCGPSAVSLRTQPARPRPLCHNRLGSDPVHVSDYRAPLASLGRPQAEAPAALVHCRCRHGPGIRQQTIGDRICSDLVCAGFAAHLRCKRGVQGRRSLHEACAGSVGRPVRATGRMGRLRLRMASVSVHIRGAAAAERLVWSDAYVLERA